MRASMKDEKIETHIGNNSDIAVCVREKIKERD